MKTCVDDVLMVVSRHQKAGFAVRDFGRDRTAVNYHASNVKMQMNYFLSFAQQLQYVTKPRSH